MSRQPVGCRATCTRADAELSGCGALGHLSRRPAPAERRGSTAASRLAPEEQVILGVAPDPEPNDLVFTLGGKRPMVKSDTRRPDPADALEVERRVPRVIDEKFVAPVGKPLDLFRQIAIVSPESSRGPVSHREAQRSVQRPASRSSSPSWMSQSSFPAASSAAI